MTQDFGKLDFRDGKATYTYSGMVYDLGSHPYEPCLYIMKDGEDVCTLHNAYTVEELITRT